MLVVPFLLAWQKALIDRNHACLVALGVSHPSLETIKDTTARSPYGLHTKLTGAGGGGCAVTLIPDGEWSPSIGLDLRCKLLQ